MKKFITIVIAIFITTLFIVNRSEGATLLFPWGGGTGIGTATAGDVGDCLKVSDDSPFTYELGACGSGGSSFAWPFTPTSWGVSTSTTIGLLNGFLSTASSTQSGSFFLPSLSQGILYTGTNGLVNTAASSSIFGFTPISNALTKGYFLVGDDSGTAQATSSIFVSSTGKIGIASTTPYALLSITQTGTDPAFIVEDSASPDTSPFIINASGNVGIGTASPVSKLNVDAISGNILALTNNGTNKLSVSSAGTITFKDGPTLTSTQSNQLMLDAPGQAQGQLAVIANGNITGSSATVLITGANTTATSNGVALSVTGVLGWSPTQPMNALADTGFSRGSAAKIYVGNGTAGDYSGTLISNVIGLGTTSPYAKLSVTQTGTDPAFIVEDSASPDTSPFIINASGNVGIGETAPGSKLSVSGGGSFGSGYDTTAAPTGGLIIEGNVGIGTTSPNFKLDVNGSANIRVTTDQRFQFGTLGSEQYIAAYNDAGSAFVPFQLFGSKYVFNSGNVGIGTTTPDHKLTVYGINGARFNVGTDQNMRIGSVNSHPYLASYNDALTAFVPMDLYGSQFALMSGNVGIGTTNPQSLLHLAKSGGASIILQNTSGNGNGYIQSVSQNGSVYATWGNNFNVSGSILEVINGGTTDVKMIVLNTGNIGIGTTTPNFKLVSTNSTGPQLSLSAGAGLNQWVMRNEGGQFALATSTYTATSSVSALRIDSNGYLTLPTLSKPAGTFLAADPNGKIIATSTPFSAMLSLGRDENTISFGEISYGDFSRCCTATETDIGNIMTRSGYVTNFFVDAFSNDMNNVATVTLYKNGSPTSITVSIASSTIQIVSDTTNTVAVVAGDRLTYKVDGMSASNGFINFSASIQINN